MKLLLTTLFLITLTFSAQGQEGSVFGKWKTIDDHTGEAKSIVEIYEKDGIVFGKIIDILNPANKDKTCINCKGDDYNEPLVGLVIIKDLEKNDAEYEGGTVVDPENGKSYKAKIWLDEENPNLLNVRGYVSFLFRTQQWIRV